ncbi:hypothetical protein [Pantoea ananatis]|nr:hypothetical protein [Pantoea ananatis]MCH9272266.1 hypothetical protein [Pantoea ananatis]
MNKLIIPIVEAQKHAATNAEKHQATRLVIFWCHANAYVQQIRCRDKVHV